MLVRLLGVGLMSRQPIGKGERVTIILNPAFPKERLILDYFNRSLNRSADIKEILYNYVIGNQLSINTQSITNDCIINDNSIINEYTMNDNSMVKDLSNNDNLIINNLPKNDNDNMNNDFNINLENIEDEEIEVEHDPKEEIREANNNALDFIKNGF